MLLHSLWTSKGLVNGSSGIIKDFVFDTNNYTVGDSILPLAIIVEFAEYNGQPFFTLPGQEKWVPLLAQKCESGEGNSNKHFRKSFPIMLSYAITAWKSQGLTIPAPIQVRLGDKEVEHGATYVVFSRATNNDNICIGSGVSV